MRKVLVSLLCVAALAGLYACVNTGSPNSRETNWGDDGLNTEIGASGEPSGAQASAITFQRVSYNGLSDDIKSRIELTRERQGCDVLQSGADCYVAAYMGKRPTGGYGIEITGVTGVGGRAQVTARETAPAKGEPVTEALTYPFDVAKLGARISGSVELVIIN